MKSVLLTSVPNKKHLEEQGKSKIEREKNKLITKNNKLRIALFSPDKPKLQRTKKTLLPLVYTAYDNFSYSVLNSSSDLDRFFSVTENEEDEPDEYSQSTKKLQLW